MAKRIRNTDDLEMITVISPKSHGGFIETPVVQELTDRSLRYIGAGYPVHLCGPTGCGKTTLAMHIAEKLERPVILINGDEEFSTSSLIGGEVGFNKKRVVDRYVSRVTKVEESYRKNWVDERLTAACKYGFTLVYNEFTRSKPEANNVLLSVIEERILPLPSSASRLDRGHLLFCPLHHYDLMQVFYSLQRPDVIVYDYFKLIQAPAPDLEEEVVFSQYSVYLGDLGNFHQFGHGPVVSIAIGLHQYDGGHCISCCCWIGGNGETLDHPIGLQSSQPELNGGIRDAGPPGYLLQADAGVLPQAAQDGSIHLIQIQASTHKSNDLLMLKPLCSIYTVL